MKQKIIFLLFVFLLSGSLVQAQTLLPDQKLPDNIIDTECFITPTATQWSMKAVAKSPGNNPVHVCSTPLTGDIDGDGEMEILVRAATGLTVERSEKINIYAFNKQTQALYLKYSISIPSSYYPIGSLTIANVNGNKYASIFYCSDNKKLYKYDFDITSKKFIKSWEQTYSTNNLLISGVPIVADFSNNGRAQVNVYDKIYDAVTGVLLCSAGTLGNSFGKTGHPINANSYMSAMQAGDIDGDGKLELVGGNCVYEITIADPTSASTSNKFELLRNADSRVDIWDGGTALIDMDMDGQLDVVVSGNSVLSNKNSIYVYNPRTGKIMHDNMVNDLPTAPHAELRFGISVPFVGDIDADGRPEIAVCAHKTLRAYKLNTTTKQLELFWEMPTADESGSTTLTLFDFNQTGYAQLIYRDEDNLRIIDGRAGLTESQRVLATIENLFSPTINEQPVVADINGDGQANILVTGATQKKDENNNSWIFGGHLYVFSSGDLDQNPWAPARTVWNTNAYNAINVNEDLTIPKVQFNPATVFPGDDGVLGTSDDVRPFNNFLQQQTMLNTNGMPIWLAPKGEITGTPTFNYNEQSDDLTVTVQVTNSGEGVFVSPFYVSVYKDMLGGSPKHTYEYTNIIEAGETVNLTFTIPEFSKNNWIPHNFIILKINDKGDGLNHQEVCDDSQSQIYGSINPIDVDPVEQDICIGNDVSKLTYSLTLPSATYQWQSSRDNVTWADIPAGTNQSYTPTNLKHGITYYRVLINADKTKTMTSASSKVRVRNCRLPVNHNISVMGY
ncbi:hypothetical protein M2459_001814 [Parabacteroides sp. PF5-5]|uniref:FG-GAP repeat domain-containing protein n=1 Tax=unclassified Parabacteroides TaxID=2649774 RepID=UPI0024734839|nr:MULTISPECIES: VCBS repeat-containing protein [unclassified Parabacteroides]MDH6305077.1 hypothetical protein [Parabacteroides sp. PH5-39]MDH6315838.1 hypothetical protein [Parabacteroides sp. PF5-13]MDH6319495.1 hypothetical protein [Parabacteroides sp. PH5-13]MDH6323226.1 hypothetical protein [Parabacteroides sp. PH5-8]MDH6327266.1 hypothetical protein [Parabacteroides sp. PH5-41]